MVVVSSWLWFAAPFFMPIWKRERRGALGVKKFIVAERGVCLA